jgi:septum site-determining protein MinC
MRAIGESSTLVNTAARSRPAITFRGQVFRALVLAPAPPLPDWIADLDALLRRSPAFFAGRAVILDLSALTLDKPALTTLIADLLARDVRILGIEGADPSMLGIGLPPRLVGGRPAGAIDMPEDEAAEASPATAAQAQTASLLLESSVRSGQSIVFPDGDVTVVGSLSSGAEIVAGGSIHVYGALRGRAVAGSARNPQARIYCRKFDPELIGINGLYNTADTVDARFRGRPIQARLNGGAIVLSALD